MPSVLKSLKLNRLALQCTLAAAVVSAVPLVLLSTIVGSHVGKTLASLSQAEAELALHELAQLAETKIEDRQLDLLTIAQSPQVDQLYVAQQGDLKDPVVRERLRQTKDALAEVFERYESIHGGTHQLRYLNTNGEEVVRVDWEQDQPQRVKEWDLQDKHWHSYFKRAAGLEAGQCYVSPITLNVENGMIQSDRPMVRYSTPVRRDGELLGVLVMNVDPSDILSDIRLSVGHIGNGEIVLIREDGTYMHHKDPAKRWGSQIGSDGNAFRDWPALAERLKAGESRLAKGKAIQFGSEDKASNLTLSRITFGDYNEGWLIGIERRRADVLASAEAMQGYIAWWAVVVGGFAVVIALLLARGWVKPVHQLSEAADRVRRGDYNARVTTAREDELGQLAKVFNEMAQEVQRVVEIEEERAKAEASSQAKSEFLANMSHEIRTPMNAILGFADLLKDPGLDAQTHDDYLNTIRRNGDHLLGIINDILDLSKIEAGKMEVEKIQTDLPCLVNEVTELMRPRATQKSIGLELELQDGLPQAILTDPLRLRQILINLMGNAIKFTESGTVRLAVSTRASEVPYHQELSFQVIDSGIGIEPEKLKNLFKAFNQADNTMSRRFGGTGLGLTICKHFAEMLDGKIQVKSIPNEGSTFTVVIRSRIVETPQASPAKTPASEPLPNAGSTAAPLTGRVLLAEDGKDNQRLIMFHLKKMGLDVTLRENGQEAMELALQEKQAGAPFDLILMDMQMPVMDGYTATARLREQGYTGPIIALTAHAMAGDREKCLAAGCDEYTTKPIDVPKVRALIGCMVQSRVAA